MFATAAEIHVLPYTIIDQSAGVCFIHLLVTSLNFIITLTFKVKKLLFKMNQKFGVKAVLIKNRPNINSYFAILEA